MNERLLVLVRSIPEKRKKGDYSVCVAGITEKGEWRRIYPFAFQPFVKKPDFHKKQWINISVEQSNNDKRAESRKLTKLNYVENVETELKIAKLMREYSENSIRELKNKKASLGAVKPDLGTLDLEIKINSTKLLDDQTYFAAWSRQGTRIREKVKMPVELRYIFMCSGDCSCKTKRHKLLIVDWEVNELSRNIMKSTQDREEIESKLRHKLVDFMKGRELYFVLGTHFKFKTWMVIGLIYPSKETALQTTLF